MRLERAELREHLAAGDRRAARTRAPDPVALLQEELTLAEIGEVIGVGESRVSQLRTQAIARLRTRLRETLQLAEMPMSKILSQDEIDALLSTPPAGRARRARPAIAATAAPVITYNFRRPDRVSKEQMRSLHFLHDRFASNVTTSLSAYLRAMTEVSIVSVEQFSYSEFLMSLSDPTAFYALAMPPLDELAALEMNPTRRLHDGRPDARRLGQRRAPQRALTEIEQNVIDSVVKLILENLTETWRAVVRPRSSASGPRDAAADAAGGRRPTKSSSCWCSI